MKKTPNILKYITALAVMFTISSCEDFLSPEPVSATNGETYYTTEAEFDLAILNMYDGISGINSTNSNDNHGIQVEFYVTEMRSDNTQTKSQEGEAAQFESYKVVATNGIVTDYYRSMYDVIFRANTVLDNLGALSSPEAYEAEAKFVRAYAYFNLVRLFGDVSLVDHVIGIDDSSIQYTRVATSTIYELIENDLNTAILGLDNSYKNRGSKAAAQALLAKVYLTLGTNYLEAQLLCEDIMGSGFVLEPNFKDVFFNELNDEIIFAISYIGDSSLDSQNFSSEMLNSVGRTSGVNYVTSDVITALNDFGGDRTPYSYRIDTAQPTQNQVVKYIPNGDDTLGIVATSSNATLAGNDWIVLRYADVLLMHVESIMAGGNETSVQTALDSFEEVRLRAGLLADDDDTITKDELLLERRVELAFENHRLFDLVRFNKAQEVLSDFADANNADSSIDIIYEYSATDLLLPMPQREVNLSNGVLNQNPGY